LLSATATVLEFLRLLLKDYENCHLTTSVTTRAL